MRGTISKLALGFAVLLISIPAIGGAAEWGTAESTGLMTPFGEYVLGGAGVNDFTEDALKDSFDTGATWNVRLGFGSRYFIGAELAYVGSIRSRTANSDDQMLANGVEGVLRLQYPYAMGTWLVEPFAFGGIGWSHLSIDNVPAGAEDTADIGVAPVGAGLMVGLGRLLLDARFAYNITFNDDELTGNSGDLTNWAVLGAIGYEF